jgi:hypothetical protein
MTGEQLYALYVRKNIEVASCAVDAWEFLEIDEQEIWNQMANEATSKITGVEPATND